MSSILQKVRDVDPNNSDAIKEVLTTFFQNIAKHTELNCVQWLQTLENILYRFPKYCSSHQGTIETYLSHFVSRSSYHDVIEAAKCAAQALQQVRWSQDRTTTAKSAWRDRMELLNNAAHSLIDALFSNCVDLYRGKTSKIAFQTQGNSNSPLTKALVSITSVNGQNAEKQAILQNRIRNIFIFMQAMIVEIYPVPKPIRPQSILDVIVRSLSITSGKNLQITDVAAVKIQALRTLDALIVCLGANLIPFSSLVFRVVKQTLAWSSDNPSQDSRNVRQSSYTTLVNWLTTLHTHRFTTGNTSWEDEFANHVIKDTTPMKKTVHLTASSQPLKNLSKKAKRKLQNTMLKESTIAPHMPGEKNKQIVEEENDTEVGMSALECVEVFLQVCGVFLKPTTHKVLQEHFVRECYNTSIHSPEYALSLLRVLEALRKTSPPTVPPPTQYCLNLYSALTDNHSKEISKFCSQALLDIRLHLHCSPPTISFALEERPGKEPTILKERTMSKRNIAALEKFLGPDKVPRQNGNYVIIIPDEPVNKKSRHDDNTDDISVSSESVYTVETDDFMEQINKDETSSESGDDINKDIKEESANKSGFGQVNKKERDSKERVDTIDAGVNPKPFETLTMPNSSINTETLPIYAKPTQVTLNTSNDTIGEEDRPLSMEVAYDYPNTGSEKVTVLEKTDDENLPSTNDTDDVQITCGQVSLTSQEVESENRTKETKEPVSDESKINETNDANGGINAAETQIPHNETDKKTTADGITVEDMLADFVDEVDEQKVDC